MSLSVNEKLLIYNQNGRFIELSVKSPFFVDDIEGLSSVENELTTSTNFGGDGDDYISSRVRARNFVIEGRIRETKEDSRNKMIRFFHPKEKYKICLRKNGTDRFLNGYLEKTPVISKGAHPSFVISFLCPSPFWYDYEVQTDIALWQSKFEFPLEIPIDTGIEFGLRAPSLIVNIVNNSDLKAPLKLQFKAKGTLTNPSIINVETREIIKVEYTMTAGDVIEVNTGYGEEYIKLIRGNTETNLFNYLTLDSNIQYRLNLGDNYFRYSSDTNVDNLEATIFYTPQFLGV